MLRGTTDRNVGTPPPLAGVGRGRGIATTRADTSDEADSPACSRAQTPPPTPSRKGRGSFVFGTARACMALSLVALLALTLAACGKRGDPVPPDGKTDEFPRQYPDPSSL